MGQEWSRKIGANYPERKYSLEETVQLLKELMAIDDKYAEYIKKGVYDFLAMRMSEMNKPEDIREALADPENVRLAGSCADGGGTCRWFRHGTPDVELDIMYQVAVVPSDEEDIVFCPIPEKPGFMKLYNVQETYDCLHPILQRERPDLSSQFNTGKKKQQFVNTMDMQRDISKIWPPQDGDGEIERISAALMDCDPKVLQLFAAHRVEGPSNFTEIIVSLQEETAISYSSDSVLAFKSEARPAEMKEWYKRIKNNQGSLYSKNTIEECFKAGTHVVAKKSPGAKREEEWRRSTSEIELILMKTWNESQKMCYFLLKCIYYRYIRGIEVQKRGRSVHIPSYALKTEMFWAIERIDPTEWSETNLKRNMKVVLDSMLESFQKRNVQNYFIPEMNVIDPETYPKELVEAGEEKLEEITNDLNKFMPCDLEKMIHIGKAILQAMEIVLAYIKFKKMEAETKETKKNLKRSGLEGAVGLLSYVSDNADLLQSILGKKKKK